MPKAKNTDQIITEFKSKHGERYDYSQTQYVNSYTKVKIGCSKHGIFSMLPTNHLRGQNCPTCRRIDKEDLICKLIKTHNNRYDYSLLEYNILVDKVKIICPVHQVFEQALQDHIKGHRCPKCRGLNRTKAELIKQLNKIHNELYIYDDIGDEIKSRDKIKIKCKEHGYFYQTVNNHLKGQGCKKCSNLIPRLRKPKPDPTHRWSSKTITSVIHQNIHPKVR